MAYEFKKGAAAVSNATTEKKDFSKAIKTLKSGSSFKVRIPSVDELVEVYIHSVYEVFYSTPCTPDDLYDKGADLIYADAKKLADAKKDKEAEELRKVAYQLRAKPRYLFGFINLEDGEPIIVDLSKKQAQGVITTIKKNEKRLHQLAFELSKTGSGQSTTVGLNPIAFPDEDLNAKELANFKSSEGKAIDEEVYANCLYVKKSSEQADDLIVFERKNKGVDLIKRLDLEKIAGEGNKAPEEPAPIDEGSEGNYEDVF